MPLLPLVCRGFDLCACQSPVFESPLQHYVSNYYKQLLESIWIGGLAGTFVWGSERATDLKRHISVLQLKCIGSSRSFIVADHWLLTYLLMLVQCLMDRFLGTTQLTSFHREWKELTAAQTQLSDTCLLFLIHTFYFIARHASLIEKYYLLNQFSISYKGKFSLGLASQPVT